MNPKEAWIQPKIPTHVNIAQTGTDKDSLATPKPTTQDEKPSPQLQDIVQNIETQLDEEVESIQYDFTAAPSLTSQNIRQMQQDIDHLQTRIDGLTGKEASLSKTMKDSEPKLQDVQKNTRNQLTQ